jgi:hypothetical protein
MPTTVKELRAYIRQASIASACPQPALSGTKASLLIKAQKLGYVSPDVKIAKAKKIKKKLKETRKKKKTQRLKTPAVISVKPTKSQQNTIDLKNQIKNVWRGKVLRTRVKPRKKPNVKPMWGDRSKSVLKGLEK